MEGPDIAATPSTSCLNSAKNGSSWMKAVLLHVVWGYVAAVSLGGVQARSRWSVCRGRDASAGSGTK